MPRLRDRAVDGNPQAFLFDTDSAVCKQVVFSQCRQTLQACRQ
jgi:hypothetical protein